MNQGVHSSAPPPWGWPAEGTPSAPLGPKFHRLAPTPQGRAEAVSLNQCRVLSLPNLGHSGRQARTAGRRHALPQSATNLMSAFPLPDSRVCSQFPLHLGREKGCYLLAPPKPQHPV